VGIVDMSMRLKKALPIFCCRVIWCRRCTEEGEREVGREIVRNRDGEGEKEDMRRGQERETEEGNKVAAIWG
jgi:hypothetical protein